MGNRESGIGTSGGAVTDSPFPIHDSRSAKTGKARVLSHPGLAEISSGEALKFGSIQLSDCAEPDELGAA
jgi:hypothetical protein